MVPYFVVVLAGRQARLRPPPRLAQFLLGPFFNLSMGVQYDCKIKGVFLHFLSWKTLAFSCIISPSDTGIKKYPAVFPLCKELFSRVVVAAHLRGHTTPKKALRALAAQVRGHYGAGATE